MKAIQLVLIAMQQIGQPSAIEHGVIGEVMEQIVCLCQPSVDGADCGHLSTTDHWGSLLKGGRRVSVPACDRVGVFHHTQDAHAGTFCG